MNNCTCTPRDPNPQYTRDELNELRRANKLDAATFNYSEPSKEMLRDPVWDAIWNEIKTWDICVPTEYSGYCGATGNHVTAVFKAIKGATEEKHK